MTGRNIIQAELNELNSSLPSGLHEPVFNLPKGYFENFADKVIAKIKSGSAEQELAEISPFLAGIPKKLPFALPENYFNSLQPLPAEEQLPPVLQYIGKELPYAVPEGYFEDFASQIRKAIDRKPGKLVSISRSWRKMAIAAMTAGIITLGSLLYFGNRGSSISVESPAWVNAKLDNVSDQGLEEFINATDTEADHKLASTEVKSQEVKAMLSDVTVNDMEAFLDELPQDEAESVIN